MLITRAQHTVFIVAITLVSGLTAISCTTTKSSAPGQTEPAAAATPADTDANADLPPELKDAQKFDPAATLDEKTVKESDFYQIRQSVEQNKAALDEGWKEQERIEANVKAANTQEEQRKAAAAKAEEDERERQRQIAIKEFEKNKDKRAKEEQKADEEVKKLPSINQNEVNWKGLED